MRIITDSDGRVLDVSFGALISCGGQDGTDYTGTVPTGYTSLEDWFIKEADKLYRWTVVDGELTLDSSAVAPVDLPVADYIVEQGTSGIWTYENWDSGKIRMTGRTTSTIYASSWTAVGNVFYATIESRNFPFTLQSVTYFNWYIQNADAGYMFFPLSNPNNSGGVTTSSTGAVAAGRPTKPNWNLDIDLFYEVEGTWK